VDTAREGATQDRHHLDVRAEQVLEEYDLELDRMLDRVAVVLQQDGLAGGGCELVDDPDIGLRLAVRGREALAREAEPVGLAVMRRAEHDESPVAVLRPERRVSGPVALPPAEWADVR